MSNDNLERPTHGYPKLNLPEYELKFQRDGNGKLRVFDTIRHKYVALTPEEYVRQRFVAWLVRELRYPASLVANEIGIELNDTRRRCDTVVYSSPGRPLMIVEYKAPGIAITQDVFDQIVRYNMVLKARYLVVTNGLCHYCCVIDYDKATYSFLPQVPPYKGLMDSFTEN